MANDFSVPLFLKYATETEGNKCKAAFYTYKQIGMRSLELFWPCTILAKNLGDVLARGLSIAFLDTGQTILRTKPVSVASSCTFIFPSICLFSVPAFSGQERY